MARVRKSGEERRQEIVDAALRIIATRGLTQLTVNGLAAELGVTGGALYRHYPSIESILEAVAEDAARLLDESLPAEAQDPVAWLERFVISRVETVTGNAGLARLLLSEQVAMAMPEAAVVHLRGAVERTRLAVERALRRGQANGAIRSDVAPSKLVPVVLGTVQMLALSRGSGLLQKMVSPAVAWSTLRTLLAPPEAVRS